MRAAAKVAGCSQGSINLEKKEMIRDEQKQLESENLKHQLENPVTPENIIPVVTW